MLATVEASWARFSGKEGMIAIDSHPASTCIIRFVPEAEAPGYCGLYERPTSGDILLVPTLIGSCRGSAEPTPCYDMVLLHEIGHAFGMNHTARGLMAASGGPFFTREDRAECLRVGACAVDPGWIPTDER